MFEKILNKEYGIEAVSIEKVNESTDGNVFFVYGNNMKYVIKKYSDIRHTNSMVKLHIRLEEIGLLVPKIILTNDGNMFVNINDYEYLVVFTFLEGRKVKEEFENGKLRIEIIQKLAQTLRKFHDNTKENEFDLKTVSFANSQKRQSVLHFDLTNSNIFACDNLIGLIDFDDSKFGDSVLDVSIAVANLFFSKKRGVDLEGVKTFLEEYYGKDTLLKEQESKLLLKYSLDWIDYVLSGNDFNSSITESFKVRKQLLKKYLRK